MKPTRIETHRTTSGGYVVLAMRRGRILAATCEHACRGDAVAEAVRLWNAWVKSDDNAARTTLEVVA